MTWLALLLAGIAGGVDAVGWLTLDGLFVAHMSGNTVSLTTHVALGQWAEVVRRGFTIVAFMSGLAMGASTATYARSRAPRAGFSIALAVEAALLAALLFGGMAASHGTREVPRHQAIAYHVLVAAAAAAMGIQSATLRSVGKARARTTYVTGVLTRLVENIVHCMTLPKHDARRRTARDTAKLLASIWFAYATGGVASGLLTVRFGMGAVTLPLVALLVAIALDWRLARRGAPGAGPP